MLKTEFDSGLHGAFLQRWSIFLSARGFAEYNTSLYDCLTFEVAAQSGNIETKYTREAFMKSHARLRDFSGCFFH